MGSVLVMICSLAGIHLHSEPKDIRGRSTQATPKHPGQSLREVAQDKDKSALRILLAIFFWFVGYNAIEAFFTLYAVNHLGCAKRTARGCSASFRCSLCLFALPAGYIGARFGRRKTIMTGIALMSAAILSMYFLPPAHV